MNRGAVLLRVDGSDAHGWGRVARCLALANALQRRRYQMTFVSNLAGSTWSDRIRRFRHFVDRTPVEGRGGGGGGAVQNKGGGPPPPPRRTPRRRGAHG